ncbi:fatty acid desaturase family protein [Winslowiella iniecta]|uniref:Fatty acid desaturase n=1 Tax=Winslowiella iniecta TaxID=1560201 RepID=A0A0L7TH89_9GAMM|nr:fatty acid desaturase [Winslowiella iniecta]KOC90270.1 fatty acid desaturase [Winslowiella iniecta]KOC94768.1 fatty acid desaturase [Winslowiella iniecta]
MSNVDFTVEKISLTSLPSRSSDVTFMLKFFIYISVIGTGIYFAMNDSLWVKSAGVFLMGAMFAHGVELQHQVLHAQGIKNRKGNELIGIILGLPMLVSYADYKYSHLNHHKFLGTPQNKEYFDYGDQYGTLSFMTIWALFSRLFMIPQYYAFIKKAFIALTFQDYEDTTPKVSRQIRRDYLVMILVITILTLLSYLYGWEIIATFWLIPFMIIASPVHALIEMPEHYQCNTESTHQYSNTRTIKSNAFMTWFTNGNNFHVEHHMMPGLPIDRLHDLHAKISGKYEHYSPTYRAFYMGILKAMLRKESNEQ